MEEGFGREDCEEIRGKEWRTLRNVVQIRKTAEYAIDFASLFFNKGHAK